LRGAWGSAGTFSFSNAIEDTHTAVQFLRDPENAKKDRIDPKRIVLIGHSMGGFMAAYTTAHDPEIAGAVLISAWNIGAEMSHELSPGRRELLAGASPRLAGTTAEGLAAEGKQNAAQWNYHDWVSALQTRPLLIVESHDGTVADNKILAERLRKAGAARCTETYMETDHGYSDHRIALQATVLNWLQAQFPAAAK